MSEARQLPLGFRLDTEATFDNFFVDEPNEILVHQLLTLVDEPVAQWMYVWGGAGRSHLLQACCHLAEQNGRISRYIPLAELRDLPAEDLLVGIDSLDILCLDDIDAVISDPEWERVLFNAYNSAIVSGTVLVATSSCPPSQLNIGLADLKSRLQSFSVFRLMALSETGLKSAFRLRASRRGLVVNDQVCEYLFARCRRELSELISVLDRLDRFSLEHKRPITVPLVRQVMGW